MNEPAMALKEWSAIVRAMETGRQILLFRKGGIREVDDEFVVEKPDFFLYPTFEHQQGSLLREEYQYFISDSIREHKGRTVRITSRAHVEAVCLLENRAAADRLKPFHIFNSDFLDMRFAYKPEKPLFVLVLRVYLLEEPFEFVERSEYIGCRSWVSLEEANSSSGKPVLGDKEFELALNDVLQLTAK
jgi:hypothetical protein